MKCPDWSDDTVEHQSAKFEGQFRSALEAAYERAKTRVPSVGDVARWHRQTFHKVAPHPDYAGGLRQRDPKRPCLARDVRVGGVDGADHAQVPAMMAVLDSYLDQHIRAYEIRAHSLGPEERLRQFAIVVGPAVGAFIKIHPFMNGNGRMSRALWSVLIHRLGYAHAFSVMARPSPPYEDVMREAMSGNFGPITAMVLEGLSRVRPTITAP